MQDKDQIKKSISDLFAARELGIVPEDEFQKALASLSHLVPRKVQIKGKDGKVHTATRWVNPETNDSEQYADKARDTYDHTDFDSAVEDIVNKMASKSEKLRNLINAGIYDKNILSLLSGAIGRAHV